MLKKGVIAREKQSLKICSYREIIISRTYLEKETRIAISPGN